MEQFAKVQRAYNELLAEGSIFPSSNQEEVEKQKALTTFRAAYYINLEDSDYGILEKLTGNNYLGFSVDIIVLHDGTFFDCMTDVDAGGSARLAKPIDAGAQLDPALGPRWRQPTRELATLPGTPIPNPDPDPTDPEIIEKLNQIQLQLNRIEAIVTENKVLLLALTNKPAPIYQGRVPLFGGNVTLTPIPQ